MAHFIPGPHHVRHQFNGTNIMLQPGGFRAVTGGASIFGNPYNVGYQGGYGYGTYPVGGCYNDDDGKLTFGQKVGSFFKGIGNTIKGAVKNLFTPKGFLKAAACVAACCIPGVGPFVAAGLAGVGIIKGAGTVIKGAQQASAATTDAEAMAAWENIGGGTFTVAASAVALKGSVGAIKTTSVGQTAIKSYQLNRTFGNSKLSSAGSAVKDAFGTARSGLAGKTSGLTGKMSTIGKNAHNAYKASKGLGKSTLKSTTNAAKSTYYTSKAMIKSSLKKNGITDVKTAGSKAWEATKAGSKYAYKMSKANPYIPGSVGTSYLNPEEANWEYNLNRYYV